MKEPIATRDVMNAEMPLPTIGMIKLMAIDPKNAAIKPDTLNIVAWMTDSENLFEISSVVGDG